MKYYNENGKSSSDTQWVHLVTFHHWVLKSIQREGEIRSSFHITVQTIYLWYLVQL